MYYTTVIGSAKAHVFDTKDLNKCEVVLSSSSSVRTLSTLAYDDIPKGYHEVARVNASLFEMATGKHLGWEFSDMYKTSQGKDSSADAMQFLDGTIKMGDISASEVYESKIKWAYTGSHVILQDGKDVLIVANWRTEYPKGKYTWSWFASRDDGTYVIGALQDGATCNADELRTFLKGLGCTNAMVNDGGGSAELIVGGKIKNRTTERKIANGLFIYESDVKEVNTNDEVKQRIDALKTYVDKELNAIKELL